MRARLLVIAVFVAAAAVPALLAYDTGVLSSPRASSGESAAGAEFRATSLDWPRGAEGLAASGDLVVWEQPASGADGDADDLWAYEVTTRLPSRILPAKRVGAGVGAPDLTGSTVTWAARGGGSTSGRPLVRGFDTDTGRLFTATAGGVLARSAGQAVVWVTQAGSRTRGRDTIGVLDTVTDTSWSFPAGGRVLDLAAAGRWIAWAAGPPGGGTVWAVQWPGGARVKLGAGSASVAADARRVVWAGRAGSAGTAIMVWDPRTRKTRRLCVVPGAADSLELGTGAVAWRQSSNCGDVGVYDFTRGRAFTVCSDGAAQADPVFAGRTVFWADRRSGRWELYGRTL
jgi:hypothetical protein